MILVYSGYTHAHILPNYLSIENLMCTESCIHCETDTYVDLNRKIHDIYDDSVLACNNHELGRASLDCLKQFSEQNKTNGR